MSQLAEAARARAGVGAGWSKTLYWLFFAGAAVFFAPAGFSGASAVACASTSLIV